MKPALIIPFLVFLLSESGLSSAQRRIEISVNGKPETNPNRTIRVSKPEDIIQFRIFLNAGDNVESMSHIIDSIRTTGYGREMREKGRWAILGLDKDMQQMQSSRGYVEKQYKVVKGIKGIKDSTQGKSLVFKATVAHITGIKGRKFYIEPATPRNSIVRRFRNYRDRYTFYYVL